MPIKVTCSCGRQMMVGDERAGRAVACPKCRSRVDVPGERREPPKAAPVTVVPSESRLETAPQASPTPTKASVSAAAAPVQPPPAPDDLDPSYTIETLPPVAPPPTDELDQSYTIETIPTPVEAPEIRSSPSPPPAALPPAPPPAPPEVRPPAPPPVARHRPGYRADPEKLTAAYVLSMLIACLGFVTVLPGALDVVRHLSNLDSDPIARWAFVVFFLGLMHFAYAIYLSQIPDWSASWMLTAATLLQGAFYAAILTALFLTGGQSEMIVALDLGPHVDNGRARAWCFVMLCLTGMAAYFCGTVSIRWRRAFVLIREVRRG